MRITSVTADKIGVNIIVSHTLVPIAIQSIADTILDRTMAASNSQPTYKPNLNLLVQITKDSLHTVHICDGALADVR